MKYFSHSELVYSISESLAHFLDEKMTHSTCWKETSMEFTIYNSAFKIHFSRHFGVIKPVGMTAYKRTP